MTRNMMKFAVSALAISAGSSAFAQKAYEDIITMTCSEFASLDATEQKTRALEFKSFPGTDTDADSEMSAEADTEVASSAGTNEIATADSGTTVLGEAEPAGDTEIVDSSGTSDLAGPTDMGAMEDDAIAPFIVTSCEGNDDTLVTTVLSGGM